VQIAVSGDLVRGGRPFCRSAIVGLVGLHILQRNPVDPKNPALRPQWIWATFEHADNAPIAESPCNVSNGCGTNPTTNWINRPSCGFAKPDRALQYSFFSQKLPPLPGRGTNVQPGPLTGTTKYPWNSRPPYAEGGTTRGTSTPQAVRCWEIFPTTEHLNVQWRRSLGSLPSVLQNYMLIGTQWGGNLEPPTPPNPVPANAVPGMLSNITLETYIQNNLSNNPNAGPGSCISCHGQATLIDNKTSANFSFLPFLADPPTARTRIKTPGVGEAAPGAPAR
jgi:hypothetical protein